MSAGVPSTRMMVTWTSTGELGFTPKSSIFTRVFHYFNHPFDNGIDLGNHLSESSFPLDDEILDPRRFLPHHLAFSRSHIGGCLLTPPPPILWVYHCFFSQ